MELLGDVGHVNLVSVRLEIVLASVKDRCMVCAKCIVVSEVILDALMVLLGDEAQVDARFGPFGDVQIFMQDRCMVYAKCTMCSAIILDAPNGTSK